MEHTAFKPQQTEFSDCRNLKPFLRELASDEYRESFGRWLRGGSDALLLSVRDRAEHAVTVDQQLAAMTLDVASELVHCLPPFQRRRKGCHIALAEREGHGSQRNR